MKLARKTILTLLVVAVLLVLAVIIAVLLVQHPKKISANHAQMPSFSTLLPSNKTRTAIKGQTIVTPGGEQTYQFSDTIDGIAISVSEQQLPANFSSGNSDDALKKFAAGFNATTLLTVGATTVYRGTSAQGPEWAIFARNDLLIIIRSASAISDASWKLYIGTMK